MRPEAKANLSLHSGHVAISLIFGKLFHCGQHLCSLWDNEHSTIYSTQFLGGVAETMKREQTE
jgi:hypothetical protein